MYLKTYHKKKVPHAFYVPRLYKVCITQTMYLRKIIPKNFLQRLLMTDDGNTGFHYDGLQIGYEKRLDRTLLGIKYNGVRIHVAQIKYEK